MFHYICLENVVHFMMESLVEPQTSRYTDGELPNHEGKSEDRFSIFVITSAKIDEII